MQQQLASADSVGEGPSSYGDQQRPSLEPSGEFAGVSNVQGFGNAVQARNVENM